MTTVQLDTAGGAVVNGMPHDEYLAHPALSASQAKTLVKPGGPARYKWSLTNPQPPRDAFDLGHAAHAAVLGVDPGLEVVMCTAKATKADPDPQPYPAPNYNTTSAQQHRDAIRAAGRTPILTADLDRVADMAAALREHPVASKLLHPDSGDPEVSLFVHDEATGVDRRGRVDWLRRADHNGRLLLVDYKTAATAEPGEFARAAARYSYAQQAAWYQDLVICLGLATTAPFVFVVQETTAPYLVSVLELDDWSIECGRALNRRAMSVYKRCVETDTWPGYTDDEVGLISLPSWALAEAQVVGEW